MYNTYNIYWQQNIYNMVLGMIGKWKSHELMQKGGKIKNQKTINNKILKLLPWSIKICLSVL